MAETLTCLTKRGLLQKFENRIAEIKNVNDPIPENTVFYISKTGCDSADGKTPASAWSTLEKINHADIPAGAYVLFERGGIWRGMLEAKPGVTYSAYGKGEKPRLYASPEDGADPKKWIKTDAKNIWRFYKPFDAEDIGCIFFDNGKSWGYKVVYNEKQGINDTTKEVFNGNPANIIHDLHFYYDPILQLLYLRSDRGNPGDLFSSIEFNINRHVVDIQCSSDVTVENLCIMYGGCHGIASGTTVGLTVRGCEFGYIGSYLFVKKNAMPPNTGRFGNGVEIYGGCERYTVEDCYFHDIFDAGATHQITLANNETLLMTNVRFRRNVMERCYYSIEYFMYNITPGTDSHIEDVIYEDNLMRDAGRGFCMQRFDRLGASHIKSGRGLNPSKNFLIRNNIMWNSGSMIIQICALTQDPKYSSCLPELSNNVYIQRPEGEIGIYSMGKGVRIAFDEDGEELIKAADPNGKYCYDLT